MNEDIAVVIVRFPCGDCDQPADLRWPCATSELGEPIVELNELLTMKVSCGLHTDPNAVETARLKQQAVREARLRGDGK